MLGGRCRSQRDAGHVVWINPLLRSKAAFSSLVMAPHSISATDAFQKGHKTT